MLFNQLTKYNIHIGHKYKNTRLLASWMLFKLYNNLWLINLNKTIWFFKLIFNFIRNLVYKKSPIWFINSEMSKQYIINQNALNCGEFYCGYIWKRGLLSNYLSMLRIIKNIIVKSNININSDFYYFFKTWYLTRLSWPRAIFVSNLKNYNIISKEAFTARVPVIGMIDTDIKNHYVNFPIPSNDDSLISLAYISSLIAKYILLYKYRKIILWFLYYISRKNSKEILDSIDSINILLNKGNAIRLRKLKLKKVHLNKFNIFNILKRGIKLLFKRILKKSKAKYSSFFSEYQFDLQSKFPFFFNLIQLERIKKRKIFFNKDKSIKLDKRFFKLNFLKLNSRITRKVTFLRFKWYFYYYFLYFMRFFKIFINTFEKVKFHTFSKVSLFYDSHEYYSKKTKIYNKKKNTWFTHRKYIRLLKKFKMLSFNFKTFYEKLNFYKKLLNLEFNKDFELLKYKSKYILTNLYPAFESFRNRTAMDNVKKYVNIFCINLDKVKNIHKILDKESYIFGLVKFMNKNTRYNSLYKIDGNRKII